MALVLGAAGHGCGSATGLARGGAGHQRLHALGAAAAASATPHPRMAAPASRAARRGTPALALVVAGGLADLERLLGIAAGLALGPMVASAAGRRGAGPPCRPPARRGARPARCRAGDPPGSRWCCRGRSTGERWGGLPPAPPFSPTSCCCWPPSFCVAWPGRHRVRRATSPEPQAERELVRDRLRAVGSTNRLAWMSDADRRTGGSAAPAAPGYLAHRVHAEPRRHRTVRDPVDCRRAGARPADSRVRHAGSPARARPVCLRGHAPRPRPRRWRWVAGAARRRGGRCGPTRPGLPRPRLAGRPDRPRPRGPPGHHRRDRPVGRAARTQSGSRWHEDLVRLDHPPTAARAGVHPRRSRRGGRPCEVVVSVRRRSGRRRPRRHVVAAVTPPVRRHGRGLDARRHAASRGP